MTSLDNLIENQENIQIIKTKKKVNIAKEIFVIGIIAMIGFVGSIIFLNFGAINANIQMLFFDNAHGSASIAKADSENTIKPTMWSDDQKTSSNDALLKGNKERIGFIFNQLPPDNRIFIDGLGIQAPVIDVKYYTEEKLEQGDFEEELMQGVVKYPGTPNPDSKGNILIFGHTSNYFWVKSEYNNIFAKIPHLEVGQQIKLARNGKIYTYDIISKNIVKPKDLLKLSEKNDDYYLSLIGCYPIGGSESRIEIVSRLAQVETQQQLAYNN